MSSAASSSSSSSVNNVTSASQSLSSLRLDAGPDQRTTDLYECFRQFTTVEVLEGDNSFACRKCWKYLNPALVQQRQDEKDAKKRAKLIKKVQKRAAALERQREEDMMNEVTPMHSPTRHMSSGLPLPAILHTRATEEDVNAARRTGGPISATLPDDMSARSPVSASNASLHSEPSLVSDTSALDDSVVTDDDSSKWTGALADGEEDSSVPDDASIFSGSASASVGSTTAQATGAPLTTANVEALSNAANDITPSASAAPSVTGVSLSGDGSHALPVNDSAKSLSQPQPFVQPPAPKSLASKSAASLSTTYSNASKEPSGAVAPSVSGKSGKSVNTKATTAPPPKKQRYIMRRAHKRYLISAPDLPPVLVVHLKRFQQTNKSSLFGTPFTNLKKRDDDLTFPQELDLAPFLAPTEPAPRREPSHRRSHRPQRKNSVNSNSNNNSDRPGPTPLLASEYTDGEAKYSLYAVVVHFGTLSTGHYSAYVKSNRYGTGPGGTRDRRWFFCSDEDVRACSVDEVLRSKAYIL